MPFLKKIYELRKNNEEKFDIEEYKDYLLNANESFIRRKTGGRHDLMKKVLVEFKRTHQKIQRAIKANSEDTTKSTPANKSNINMKEYNPS